MSDIIKIYPTLADLLKQVGADRQHHLSAREFTGYMTTAQACEYVGNGATPAQCKPTEELLSLINDRVSHRQKMQHVAGPTGSRVVVAEVLAGVPYPMRRRKSVEHDLAALRIVVEPLVSGGVQTSTLAKRGAAVAALAMRLSETRPVELWAAWGGSMLVQRMQRRTRVNALGRVKLDTNPLTISEVVAVMATPQFARNVLYCETIRQTGGSYGNDWNWAWDMEPGRGDRTARIREALNLEPQDIFIPGGHLYENAQFATDPVAWVEKYVNDQRDTEHEDA